MSTRDEHGAVTRQWHESWKADSKTWREQVVRVFKKSTGGVRLYRPRTLVLEKKTRRHRSKKAPTHRQSGARQTAVRSERLVRSQLPPNAKLVWQIDDDEKKSTVNVIPTVNDVVNVRHMPFDKSNSAKWKCDVEIIPAFHVGSTQVFSVDKLVAYFRGVCVCVSQCLLIGTR